MSANDIQIGGNHYQGGKLQHWDLIIKTASGYAEGNATKYLTRWRKKNGVQDLRKSMHYLEKLLEEASTNGVKNRSWFVDPDRCGKAEGMLNLFYSDNKIGAAEELAMSKVLFWTEPADIEFAIQLVLGLIKEYEDAHD